MEKKVFEIDQIYASSKEELIIENSHELIVFYQI